MGKTGELVTKVFSKNRSFQRHNVHAIRSNAVERKRWSASVRSYFCGDELNFSLQMEDSASARSSVVAEVDLSSFRGTNVISSAQGGDHSAIISVSVAEEDTSSGATSSEATVNQPLYKYGDNSSKDMENRQQKRTSTYNLFQQEDAAIIIQSAFRSFRARRASSVNLEDEKPEVTGSPSRQSIGTSIEVQTGNSSDIFSIKEESIDLRPPVRHGARAQLLKPQEDWDDSTVSSVMSKMRIQHRLEAATRRERALAYAFSQQLRICSKKKYNTTRSNETNVGWSWLDRWMATRQPESYTMSTGDPIGITRKTVVGKRLLLDSSMEEKESCGSNDVSSLLDVNNLSVTRNIPGPPKVSSKATRNFTRQKTTSSRLCPRESKDIIKKEFHIEDEKEKRKRSKKSAGQSTRVVGD